MRSQVLGWESLLDPICRPDADGLSVSFFNSSHTILKYLSCVDLSDDGGELAIKFFVRFEHQSQPDKSPYDGDVYFYRLFAVQHTREHCDALFCESTGKIPPATVSRGFFFG